MLLLPTLLRVRCRTTAPPGVLELLVAQRWLTLCLRCTGKQGVSSRAAMCLLPPSVPVAAVERDPHQAHPNHPTLTHPVPRARCVRNLLGEGADSRHKSLALWEKLLARQAAAVRAIRHRAAVANTPGATGACSAAGLSASVGPWKLVRTKLACRTKLETGSCPERPCTERGVVASSPAAHLPVSRLICHPRCRWCTPQGPATCPPQPAVSTTRDCSCGS